MSTEKKFQFTPSFVQSVVGSGMRVRQMKENIQVDIAAMQSPRHNIGFYRQAQMFAEAVDKLNEAGYPCTYDDIRSGYRGRDGWTSWPHLWVNKEQPNSAVDVKALLEENTKNVTASVISALQAAGVLIAAPSAPAEETENTEGEDEVPFDE